MTPLKARAGRCEPCCGSIAPHATIAGRSLDAGRGTPAFARGERTIVCKSERTVELARGADANGYVGGAPLPLPYLVSLSDSGLPPAPPGFQWVNKSPGALRRVPFAARPWRPAHARKRARPDEPPPPTPATPAPIAASRRKRSLRERRRSSAPCHGDAPPDQGVFVFVTVGRCRRRPALPRSSGSRPCTMRPAPE